MDPAAIRGRWASGPLIRKGYRRVPVRGFIPIHRFQRQLGLEIVTERGEHLLGRPGGGDGLRKVEQAVEGLGSLREPLLGGLLLFAGIAEPGDHLVERSAELVQFAGGGGHEVDRLEVAADDIPGDAAKGVDSPRIEPRVGQRAHELTPRFAEGDDRQAKGQSIAWVSTLISFSPPSAGEARSSRQSQRKRN